MVSQGCIYKHIVGEIFQSAIVEYNMEISLVVVDLDRCIAKADGAMINNNRIFG